MAENRHTDTPPSNPDGEGVRIVPKSRTARRGARLWVATGVIAIAASFAWWVLAPNAPHPTAGVVALTEGNDTTQHVTESSRRASPSAAASIDDPSPSRHDPDDLASHFQPGDPEPTGAEVIEALHGLGIRSGLGAFNPPGTSPPLEGLAVPDNFNLPPGYLRHHQVTDEGVPIEPILMFSPDFTLYDANGRPIAMPANRVVPPELAPPGMPLRRVRVN